MQIMIWLAVNGALYYYLSKTKMYGRVRIHVRWTKCPLFPKMYFKPLKKKGGDSILFWVVTLALWPQDLGSGRSFLERTKVLSHCWASFDWADADSAPGSRVKISASHSRNIIYSINTRKTFGSNGQIGSSPSQESTLQISIHTAMQRDWSCWPGVEALLRNRLRWRAGSSNFGPCSLSGASQRSLRTNQRPKRPWLCRDIGESRCRSLWAEQDACIRNRLRRQCSDSRGGPILAQAISQGRFGCPNAPILAQKGRGFVEIPANQGVAPLRWAVCSRSKSSSQSRAAQQFRPWQSLKGISAVPTQHSAHEKPLALSRYPDDCRRLSFEIGSTD